MYQRASYGARIKDVRKWNCVKLLQGNEYRCFEREYLTNLTRGNCEEGFGKINVKRLFRYRNLHTEYDMIVKTGDFEEASLGLHNEVRMDFIIFGWTLIEDNLKLK